jgi:hypothetical protein
MSSFLQNYQRQPKLFVDLPSKGKYYDSSIIEDEQYVQVPVFGMNAMDEIMFKTPDALFGGEATSQVIRSCIPAILNPWKLVGFDIDYILIAIRIATYGDNMAVSTACPKCQTKTENNLSLTRMIQNYESYPIDHSFTINDLTFHLKPLSYKQMTDFSIENYSYERQLLQIAQDKTMSEDNKNVTTKEIYNKINDMNLRVAVSYIKSISNNSDLETNIEAITQFVTQNDAVFYNKLKESVFELSNRWRVPKMTATCANETCDHTYESRVDLDYSNFFGLKFLHSRNLIS